jgi:hypothetical protein
MLGPELGKAGFQIGVFVSLVSGLLLLVLDRDSAEFVISLFTFIVGFAFLLLIVALVRMGTRRR